MTLGKLVLS